MAPMTDAVRPGGGRVASALTRRAALQYDVRDPKDHTPAVKRSPDPKSDAAKSEAKMSSLGRLLRDDRGAVFVEYISLNGLVALVSLPALLYCGFVLAQSFVFVRDYVLYPFP